MTIGLVVLLGACSGPGFDRDELKKFPGYEEVYWKAFGKNGIYLGSTGYLKLARKPDGWYVVQLDNENNEKEFTLFWSASEQKYTDYKPSLMVKNANAYPTPPSPSDITMFSVIPFYGYKNWYDDVISNFEGAELTDTLTEALARAYDAKASLESGLSYGVDGKTVKKFSNEQEEKFVSGMDKALETYQALHKMNPTYNTIVGNAWNKYSNECMYVYSSVKYFGSAGKADKYLKEDLYSPMVRSFAKNILTSCDKNAILITYGDNDYYPLIYTQEKLGYRKDVAVLNISLMMVDNYIEKFITTFDLHHRMDVKAYSQKELDIIILSDNNDTLRLGDILSDFSAGRLDGYARPDGSGNRYVELKGHTLFFKKDMEPTDGYTISLPKSYVYKNDLFLWDLLLSNPKRPVSLTSVGSWSAYLPYTKEAGLVYTFTRLPVAQIELKNMAQPDTARTEKLLLEEYNYGWTGKNPDNAEKNLANNYLYQFYHLALYYSNTDKEKAVKIVNKAMEIFPQKTLPASFNYCALANVLKDVGEEDKAVNIYLQYLDDLDVKLKTAIGKEKEDLLHNLESTYVMLGMSSPQWERVRQKAKTIMDKYPRKMEDEMKFYQSGQLPY